MDPKHSGDVVKHLEKQKELMMDAYRSMSHELHKLDVEQSMLMGKFHEYMKAQGFFDKKTSDGVDEDEENSVMERWSSLLAGKKNNQQGH